MSAHASNPVRHNLAFLWVALATLALLSIPFVAMLLTVEVDWSVGDFIVMGILLFSFGSGFVLLSRRVQSKRRIAVAISLVVLFLYIWAELAVGLFTNLGS